MHLINLQEGDAAACLAVETEIESLFHFPLEEIAVSAGPRPVGGTSPPNCARTHGDPLELRLRMGKAPELCRLCFVYKSESSST